MELIKLSLLRMSNKRMRSAGRNAGPVDSPQPRIEYMGCMYSCSSSRGGDDETILPRGGYISMNKSNFRRSLLFFFGTVF